MSVSVFLDPITSHFGRDRLFGEHPYGEYNEPFIHVRDVLGERGIAVHTADYLLDGQRTSAVNLYFALGNTRNYKQIAKRGDAILSGLFHFEAPIVHPTTYRETPEAAKYFKRVYSFSTPEALAPFGCEGMEFISFRIPEPYDGFDPRFDELWRRGDRKFLCMITQNKLPRLDYNELYTERLRLLEHFSRTGSIDLYGIGWNQLPFRVGEGKPWAFRELERVRRYVWERLPLTRNHPFEEVIRRVYRGPVQSKYETMSGYTFAICYENMLLDGWINEKIFDAFLVGTVPVYLGGTDVGDYIPEDCFIDPRRFASHAELEAYLRSLSEEEVQQYRENARAFMSSERYYPFTKRCFGDLIAKAVEEDIAHVA